MMMLGRLEVSGLGARIFDTPANSIEVHFNSFISACRKTRAHHAWRHESYKSRGEALRKAPPSIVF